MRWKGARQSDNVEDRRGMSISRGAKVGGIGGLGLVAIVVISMFMGVGSVDLAAGCRTKHTIASRVAGADR